MGYILPVTNFTYNDYQKRMTKDTERSHYVSKPYKVTLDMKQKELLKKKENQKLTENKYKGNNLTIKQMMRTRDMTTENDESQLTGKGIKFNEFV